MDLPLIYIYYTFLKCPYASAVTWAKYKQFICYYRYSYNKYFNQASDFINLLTCHH